MLCFTVCSRDWFITTGPVCPEFENDDDDGNASAIFLSPLGLCLYDDIYALLSSPGLISSSVFVLHAFVFPLFTSIPYVLPLLLRFVITHFSVTVLLCLFVFNSRFGRLIGIRAMRVFEWNLCSFLYFIVHCFGHEVHWYCCAWFISINIYILFTCLPFHGYSTFYYCLVRKQRCQGYSILMNIKSEQLHCISKILRLFLLSPGHKGICMSFSFSRSYQSMSIFYRPSHSLLSFTTSVLTLPASYGKSPSHQ